MKKLHLKLFIVCIFLFKSFTLEAQTIYLTKKAHVQFIVISGDKTIEAHNNTVAATFNPATVTIEFTLLMKSFIFTKTEFEDKFNSEYVDSDNFPKACFKGKITNYEGFDLKSPENVVLTIQGELTIKGISKQLTLTSSVHSKSGNIEGNSEFTIHPADFNINLNKKSEPISQSNVEINVEFLLEPKE